MINHTPAKRMTASAIALTVIIWLAAMIVIWGCGKKGPPEPPSGNKPPQVMDLGYSISENTIKLSWTNPKTTEKAKFPVAGFLVFRFQQPAHQRECPNCPVIFKQVGDVPSGSDGRDQTGSAPLIFSQSIEPGYRYIYKVRAYDNGGVVSRDSNFVQFLF